MDAYLASTAVVDWKHPTVRALAGELGGADGAFAIAGRCFRWVRDEVRHSVDARDDVVTLAASEVLAHRTGFCYAKSHLLAALLRANDIPAGFGYQRLSVDDRGSPLCLHGFAVVLLPEAGWLRVDPRGNRPGLVTEFAPPGESLAFEPRLAGERTFDEVWPEPLAVVVEALRQARSVRELMTQLPDWNG